MASGVTLNLDSAFGTALAADFTPISGATVSFAASSTTPQTVNVVIANDALDENDETFSLALTNLVATGDVTLGAAAATGTILDDDATPSLTITNQSQPEGNAGTSTMTFTVNLSSAAIDHFLQVAVTLEVSSAEVQEQVKSNMPVIRSRVLMLLASKTAEELSNTAGKQKLMTELLAEPRPPLPLLTPAGEPAPFVHYRLTQGNTNIFLLDDGIAYQFNRMHYPEGYLDLEREDTRDPGAQQQSDALREQVSLETFRMDMVLELSLIHISEPTRPY